MNAYALLKNYVINYILYIYTYLKHEFHLKVVDLICSRALNILIFGMNEECTILMTSTGVASFLVLGGQDTQMYRQTQNQLIA